MTKLFTDFDFLDDELNKDMEVGSFGWTSTTELNDEFTSENGHISPCGSESDHVTSAKDDEVSADEEDPDVSFFILQYCCKDFFFLTGPFLGKVGLRLIFIKYSFLYANIQFNLTNDKFLRQWWIVWCIT